MWFRIKPYTQQALKHALWVLRKEFYEAANAVAWWMRQWMGDSGADQHLLCQPVREPYSIKSPCKGNLYGISTVLTFCRLRFGLQTTANCFC